MKTQVLTGFSLALVCTVALPAWGQAPVVTPPAVCVRQELQANYASTATEGYLRGLAEWQQAQAQSRLVLEQARTVQLQNQAQAAKQQVLLAQINDQKAQLANTRYQAAAAATKARQEQRLLAQADKLRQAVPNWSRTPSGELVVPRMLEQSKYGVAVQRLDRRLRQLETSHSAQRHSTAREAEQLCTELLAQLAQDSTTVPALEYSAARVFVDQMRTYLRACGQQLAQTAPQFPTLVQVGP